MTEMNGRKRTDIKRDAFGVSSEVPPPQTLNSLSHRLRLRSSAIATSTASDGALLHSAPFLPLGGPPNHSVLKHAGITTFSRCPPPGPRRSGPTAGPVSSLTGFLSKVLEETGTNHCSPRGGSTSDTALC
ncbi:unnamed protein product [Boreogadus saida]